MTIRSRFEDFDLRVMRDGAFKKLNKNRASSFPEDAVAIRYDTKITAVPYLSLSVGG